MAFWAGVIRGWCKLTIVQALHGGTSPSRRSSKSPFVPPPEILHSVGSPPKSFPLVLAHAGRSVISNQRSLWHVKHNGDLVIRQQHRAPHACDFSGSNGGAVSYYGASIKSYDSAKLCSCQVHLSPHASESANDTCITDSYSWARYYKWDPDVTT